MLEIVVFERSGDEVVLREVFFFNPTEAAGTFSILSGIFPEHTLESLSYQEGIVVALIRYQGVLYEVHIVSEVSMLRQFYYKYFYGT